jgi:carbamoyltransferase
VIILGITHPISWNPAACLLKDGELIAFAEEERFVRLKHAPHMVPSAAIAFCLEQAGLSPSEVDVTAVGFERPSLEHVGPAAAEAYLAGTLSDADWFAFHNGLASLSADTRITSWGRRWYADHHLSHAASAAIPSAFERTNVITLDAWGGRASGILGTFDRKSGFKILHEIEPEDSWGMTY